MASGHARDVGDFREESSGLETASARRDLWPPICGKD